MLSFEKIMEKHYQENPKILEARAKYEMDNIFRRCTRVNRMINNGVDPASDRVQRVVRGSMAFIKRYKFLKAKLESGQETEA